MHGAILEQGAFSLGKSNAVSRESLLNKEQPPQLRAAAPNSRLQNRRTIELHARAMQRVQTLRRTLSGGQ